MIGLQKRTVCLQYIKKNDYSRFLSISPDGSIPPEVSINSVTSQVNQKEIKDP